ncbi:MAG TPA: DUF1080 domain-containing protein [Usitatibacter sp.]|nr:DUF1080 domain-containing protein [Usitatibacter sp.]
MKKTIVASVAAAVLAGCSGMNLGTPGGYAESGSGWTTVFDGSSLSSFHPIGNANWRMADGAVVADGGQGFLVTNSEYGDFQIRVEFYAEADTNSGVFIRCSRATELDSKVCYEVNIWDARPAPEYGTGAIVDVVKVTKPYPLAGGRWNTYDITAKGDHFVVLLNGQRTAEGNDRQHAHGPIGLQYFPGNDKAHGSVLKIRKVQIRSL